jgi:hypothetical protein
MIQEQTIRLPSPPRRATAAAMSRVTLFARVAFWAAAVLALVMALLPQPPDLPFDPSDKIQHAAAFMSLTVLALIAYPRIPPIKVGLALLGFGAGIEFFQLIPTLHRDAQLGDWYVDAAAIAVVLVTAAGLRRLPKLSRS